MTLLAPHLEAWLRIRLPVERGASPHTVVSYSRTWQLLLEFAAARCKVAPSNLPLEQIDAVLVLAFLEHLENARHNQPRTRNARLAAIRAFFRFVEHRVPAALEQVRRILAIPVKKTDSPLVGHLSPEEIRSLLDAPDPTRPDGIRDRAMLHLALASGLRAGELIGLRLEDLVFQPVPAVTVRGKGRRQRCLPLHPRTTAALRAWLAVRPPSNARELFLSARRAPLSRDGLAWILRKHAATAANRTFTLRGKRVFPHLLRHTCAMTVLQNTGDIRRVALWLGHAHLQTTEVYLRADPVEKLQVLRTLKLPSLRPGRFQAPDRLLAMIHASRTAHDYPERPLHQVPVSTHPVSPHSG